MAPWKMGCPAERKASLAPPHRNCPHHKNEPNLFLSEKVFFSDMSRRASYAGGSKLPTGKSNGISGQENGAPFGPAAPPRKRWSGSWWWPAGFVIGFPSNFRLWSSQIYMYRSALSKGGLMFGSQNNLSYLSSASTTSKDSISSTLKPGRGLREPSMERGNKVDILKT